MAKLPNVTIAIVAETKLTQYLLDMSHPKGAAKARFLVSFGFATDGPDELREALLEHADANEVSSSQSHAFGTRYEIDGPLSTPDGRNPRVRTVWNLDHGEEAPRLITLVPRDRNADGDGP